MFNVKYFKQLCQADRLFTSARQMWSHGKSIWPSFNPCYYFKIGFKTVESNILTKLCYQFFRCNSAEINIIYFNVWWDILVNELINQLIN